jgi:ribosomal protein L11 methyltransferase
MRDSLIPHQITHRLLLDTDGPTARRLADLIGETLDPEDAAIAAFEQADGRTWRLEVFFASEPDAEALRAVIAGVAGSAAAGQATFDAVAARDWVAASLDGLKPVEAGRFFVHGGHDRALARPHRVNVEIDAALAFGTGHHGTTRGCLMALDALLKQRRPGKVLDVGTGTGVLAIAAAKALKRTIHATDIDPVAVAVAKENRKLNATPAYIRLGVASGLRHSAVVDGIPFDAILANILYKPLTKLAPAIARAAAPGGTLILSGLLVSDVPGTLSAYRAQGFSLVARRHLEGWATLTLRRGGAAARPRRANIARRPS